MSITSSPFSYDPSFTEAWVTNVDPIRFVCSLKTSKGQYFQEVPWLLPSGGVGVSGIHFSPNVGDRVIVNTSLGYPFIMGCLPISSTGEGTVSSVTGGSNDIDLGNSTSMVGGYVANPNKPGDFLPGDKVISSEGGGLIALLANDTVHLRASPLAGITMSKFDDLVRVVARNWERFSDVGQQTVANVKNRVYEFVGWDRKLSKSTLGFYELTDIIGDVAAGEILRGEPDPTATLPSADSRIRKYSLENATGVPIMVEVLEETGKATFKVISPSDPGTYSKRSIESGSVSEVSTSSGVTSTISVSPSTITISHSGGATATLNSSSITLSYSGGATTVLDSNGVRSSFSGHFVNIDSSGVNMG